MRFIVSILSMAVFSASFAGARDLALIFDTGLLGDSVGVAVAGDLDADVATEVAAIDVATGAIDVSGFACFQAPLIDMTTGREAGIGVDCLSPEITLLNDTIVPDNNVPIPGAGVDILPADSVGARVTAVTFFFLPGGTIVNAGLTSVLPVFPGVGDGDNNAVTHITGSLPDGTSGIVYADGRFQTWEGTGIARLSGAVNMATLVSDGEIGFSCVFHLMEPEGARGGS